MNTKETVLSKKLAARILEEYEIEVIPVIHRVRSGYWQKSAGAWSWFMLTRDNREIGSQFRAKDVVKAKKLSIYHSEINIEEINIEESGG